LKNCSEYNIKTLWTVQSVSFQFPPWKEEQEKIIDFGLHLSTVVVSCLKKHKKRYFFHPKDHKKKKKTNYTRQSHKQIIAKPVLPPPERPQEEKKQRQNVNCKTGTSPIPRTTRRKAFPMSLPRCSSSIKNTRRKE